MTSPIVVSVTYLPGQIASRHSFVQSIKFFDLIDFSFDMDIGLQGRTPDDSLLGSIWRGTTAAETIRSAGTKAAATAGQTGVDRHDDQTAVESA